MNSSLICKHYNYIHIYSPALISSLIRLLVSVCFLLVVSHREGGEGQTDASKAVQGESQEDECWQNCRQEEKQKNIIRHTQDKWSWLSPLPPQTKLYNHIYWMHTTMRLETDKTVPQILTRSPFSVIFIFLIYTNYTIKCKKICGTDCVDTLFPLFSSGLRDCWYFCW